MHLETTQLYTSEFNIVSPPAGLQHIMPFTVELTPTDPDDVEIFGTETRFNLETLSPHIKQTILDLSEDFPDEDPERHPDVITMRTAYEALETKQAQGAALSDLNITRDIG